MNRSLRYVSGAYFSRAALSRTALVLGLTFAAFTAAAHADPPYVPAPRLAVPGQAPRPYRHFDFTQPSPFGVIVTYYQNGRAKQVFTYPGYRNGLPEPDFLYFGDPWSRHTYGVNR
jgi:hypothetical protein